MADNVDQYVVVGHPIEHSRSPFIHRLFASQTGERLDYNTLDIAPENFTAAVGEFVARGGRGMNVTVPLKELAFGYADELTARARRAGAVNTLCFDADGPVRGDNTDGVGLVNDLTENLRRPVAGARVLLLGAGGATRGVLGPVLDLAPHSVLVANRTFSRALDLVAVFEADGPVRACALDAIPDAPFDLVINATASGLSGARLPLRAQHLAPGALCYDMMYAARPTAFVQQALELGAARAVDGRGMLVEQAAEAFALWRGVRPSSAPVIEALTRALDASL